MSIYEQENQLLEALKNTYSPEEQKKFVYDGLCWKAISKDIPKSENDFWPESLWANSNRRILFLLKEPRHDGEDYKDWDWGENREVFGNVLWHWLYTLQEVNKNHIPDFRTAPTRRELSQKHPLAIVNVKKTAGGNAVPWDTIKECAKRDAEFLKKQIREILKPNIVVCGGSNDSGDESRKVISIALDNIFDDICKSFIKVNNWCTYSREHNILLIDSYHPSCRGSYYDKIYRMGEAVNEFMKKENIDF